MKSYPDERFDDDDAPALYGAVNVDRWGKPRIGDWIQTHSGLKFHILDSKPEDFKIEDIAHALAHQCRFAGHTSKFYSVAEHSVRVALRVMHTHPYVSPKLGGAMYGSEDGRDLARAALLHDASEAYLTDVPRPFKHLPEFKFYRDIEDRTMRVISWAFEFEYPFHPAIKKADEILLGTEARDLMAPVIDGWHFRYDHLPEKIRPWSPRKAKRLFLKLYRKLEESRGPAAAESLRCGPLARAAVIPTRLETALHLFGF